MKRKRQQWSYLITLTLHIYWVPHWPRVIWKMDSGVFFNTLYVTITNSERYKMRMLIVIHFNLWRSFLYRDLFCRIIVKKRTFNQNKNTNAIAYRNDGNCPYSQNFGALGLSLFSLMVNPRLPICLFLFSINVDLKNNNRECRKPFWMLWVRE